MQGWVGRPRSSHAPSGSLSIGDGEGWGEAPVLPSYPYGILLFLPIIHPKRDCPYQTPHVIYFTGLLEHTPLLTQVIYWI